LKWRGGLKFRFKLVKNEFYSGRIGVLFQPVETGGSLATTTTDLGLAYNRVIVDIRTTNTFEIHVPYTSIKTYLERGENFGSVVVYVVDPLVCPDNLAGDVPILIEVAGCEDFEYADYIPLSLGPMVPFAAQSGTEVEVHRLGESAKPSLAASKVAIGERFTSLRQLSKIFSYRGQTLTYNAAQALWTNPFTVFFAGQPTSVATAYTFPEMGFDTVNLIMACYGIHLGSMRVQAFPTLATGESSTFQYGLNRFTGTNGQWVPTSFEWVRRFVDYPKEDIDLIIPAFTKFAGRTLAGMLGNSLIGSPVGPTGVGSTSNGPSIRLWSGASPTQLIWFRQFSDDGTCTNFVSVPGISSTGY